MSAINANSSAAVYTPVTEPALAAKAQQPLLAETKLRTDAGNNIPVESVVNRAELEQALDVVNQAVALDQRSLSFSIDDVSGRSVIKVVDFETDELIKQIPSEELLKVAQDIKRLQEEMGQSIGLLIDKTV